ncbi:hypothetical protein I5138_15505 [Escherichia coli]|nr:hypothetical protein [Escherichia coli]
MDRVIKIIKVVSKSILLTAKYLFLCFFSKKKLNDSESVFIVSLTTYGNRLNFVFLTIESILQQKYKPRRVLLWLYEKDKSSFLGKYFLKKQISRGLEVIYLKEDFRSFKKLSYVYQHNYMSDYFVTADDDVFYPYTWLSGFKDAIDINPHAVYCYRGRIISMDSKKELKPYHEWSLATKKNLSGNLLLPTGVSGICYPRKALGEKINDFSAISKYCPFADDIWYKMVTTSNGYISLLVTEQSEHFTPIITGFAKGLEKIKVYQDKNTEQFKSSLKYFNLSLLDFQ